MDASSRLNAIFGVQSTSLETLTAKERLELVETVITQCKPYLKYLPDFRPLEEVMHGNHDSPYRYSDLFEHRDRIEVPRPLEMITQCAVVALLEKTDVGPSPPAQNTLRLLLLTRDKEACRDGKLVEWRYEYKFDRPYCFDAHNTERSTFARAKILSESELLSTLDGSSTFLFLRNLNEIVEGATKRKKQQLESAKSLSSYLAGITQRTRR